MTREVFNGMKESEREEERNKDDFFYYESRHEHHAPLTVSIICFEGMEEKKMKEISEISSCELRWCL